MLYVYTYTYIIWNIYIYTRHVYISIYRHNIHIYTVTIYHIFYKNAFYPVFEPQSTNMQNTSYRRVLECSIHRYWLDHEPTA